MSKAALFALMAFAASPALAADPAPVVAAERAFAADGLALGVRDAFLKHSAPEAGDAWALVTADLVDPPAERSVFRARAVVLIVIYALGIASDAVAKGAREKASAESVTAAMVRSVMACTLWVVVVELVSLLVVYGARGG